MKFLKSLPKDKLQKLILVVIMTLIGLGLVINFYVLPRAAQHSEAKELIRTLTAQIESVEAEAKQEADNAALREQLRAFIATQQERMVSGDPFIWVVREISLLAETRPIRILSLNPGIKAPLPQLSQYEQYSVRLDVGGTYDHLGQFIRDLENSFPTGTIRSLTLLATDPDAGQCRASVDLALLVRPKSADEKAAAKTITGKKKTA